MASSSRPRRLLVTGAAGFLGQRVCRCAAVAGWQVLGTVRRRRAGRVGGVRTVPVDVTDGRALQSLLEDFAPHGVVHTAAVSDPGVCQAQPARTRRVNVAAAVDLAHRCAERRIAFAFTSSDLVFDGRRAPYSELDTPSPISTYGEQKAAAERGILNAHPLAAVCRMPLMIGPSAAGAVRFEETIARRLQAGRTVDLFVDEYRTPVDTDSAAAGPLLALERGSGVLHLGGRLRASRHDIGAMIAGILGADKGLLKPVRHQAAATPGTRPADVSLDSRRAYAMGYDPTPLAQALAGLFKKSVTDG
jgi:dTDP-4-dehydrorhamnose reductase